MGRLFPRYDLRNTQYFFERLNEHLEQTVRAHTNAYLFDVDRVVRSLGARFIQDDAVEFISHGSFMPMPGPDETRMEPMAPLRDHYDVDWIERLGPAMWAELLAMYRTVRQIDPVKLVVVDLDDTMWKGISGDMADLEPSEMLGFWPMGFAEALTWLKKRGILLAILSKNEEQRIREIFPKIYGPKLPLSEFAAVMVNWRPKAESMAEILETMNLLPRNVVFIDDNPVERAAMLAAFPAMRVIGRYPYYLRRVLLWSAETQVTSVTAESGRRTQMIQRQFERESKRRELPREDFLRNAAPQVTLTEIKTTDHPRFARVLELINKTNQFNTTGRRWKLEEIQALLNDGGHIYAFDVTDNFTAYGLVGVVLVTGNAIVQWVMSCRVLGYQIEQAVMASITERLTASATDPIHGTLVETDVNFPCRSLFSNCGFVQDGTDWRLPEGGTVAVPGHITMHVEIA
jgi:FkbH-like protein